MKVCLATNIVFVYGEDISSLFSTDALEEVLKSYYQSQITVNTSTIGESVKIVTAPEKAIHIMVNEDKLLVADFAINETNKPRTDFLEVARKLHDTIGDSTTLKQYGFNFTVAERNITDDRLREITNCFFKEGLQLADTDHLNFALPVIGYKKGNFNYIHHYNVKADSDSKPQSLMIEVNAERRATSITPTNEELQACYQTAYEGIEGAVK